MKIQALTAWRATLHTENGNLAVLVQRYSFDGNQNVLNFHQVNKIKIIPLENTHLSMLQLTS